jgi:hypothetical protein
LKDLLGGILNSLSKIRGSESYLFSKLLQRSQRLLRLDEIPLGLSLPTALIQRVDAENNYWPQLPDEGESVEREKLYSEEDELD